MNRFRWLFRRRNNVDLSHEIDAHLAERVDELVEDGVSVDEARVQAKREFGNRTLEIERSREIWIAPWLSSVWQDLRYAVRSLARQPGFTLSAVGILAIGIGFVTALFTVFNAVVLRPWSVPDPASIALVRPRPAPGQEYGTLTNVEYRYLRDHSRSFTSLATWMPGGGRIEYGSTSMNVQFNYVSANYFDTLRVGVTMGRPFQPEDEDYTTPRAVAIVSERLWREYFGSPVSIVGDTILIRDRPFTIVGVAEAGFFDTEGTGVRRDLWLPYPSIALLFDGFDEAIARFAEPRQFGAERVAGRLAPGVSMTTAQAELDVLGRQFRSTVPMDAYGYTLHSTRPLSVGGPRLQLPVFGLGFGVTLLVMLLVCANVGNLLLARGLSRQREIAIRLSLGANRARVTRQLLTEALLLSVLASGAGLVAAVLATQWFVRSQGSALLSNPDPYVPDIVVYGFALGMAALTCLSAGVMPAMRSTRVSVAARAANRHTGHAGAGRLRTTLLAAQLALSMVLLVTAGLLTRAIGQVTGLDPGFAVREVQALTIQFPDGTTPERQLALTTAVRNAVRTGDLPMLAFADASPISSPQRILPVRRSTDVPESARAISLRPVSTEYFNVAGIPMVVGRSLADDTSAEGVQEIVVNESAARLFWPDGNALGQRLLSGDGGSLQAYDVVGVAKDVASSSPTTIEPVIYVPPRSQRFIFVRDLTPVPVERLTAFVQGIEPDARVTARPLTDDLMQAAREVAFASQFAWGIGLLALTLATIGAFGVFAYTVEERRREIGLRMALGAQARQVVWTVISGVRRPLLFGLGAGLILSLAAAPLIGRFLYGLSPFDPFTYAGIAAILVAAALVATWIPARRATRIDPAVTLRGD